MGEGGHIPYISLSGPSFKFRPIADAPRRRTAGTGVGSSSFVQYSYRFPPITTHRPLRALPECSRLPRRPPAPMAPPLSPVDSIFTAMLDEPRRQSALPRRCRPRTRLALFAPSSNYIRPLMRATAAPKYASEPV